MHTLGDAHLYSNHMEQVDLQLQRAPLAMCTVKLNPEITDVTEFTFDDIEICDYQSHAHIKAPVAV